MGQKKQKLGVFLTIIIVLKIILMCLEVYTMRSNTLSIGNTGRITVLGFEKLVFDFSFFPKKKKKCKLGNLTVSFLAFLLINEIIFNLLLKINAIQASLVIQWLRLHAPNAGGKVQSLVRELDSTCPY